MAVAISPRKKPTPTASARLRRYAGERDLTKFRILVAKEPNRPVLLFFFSNIRIQWDYSRTLKEKSNPYD